MASSSSSTTAARRSGMECLFECCKCHKKLNKNSQSFVCLHNLCEACLPQEECPECGEIFMDGGGAGKMSQLPSYLLKMLRRERIQCPEWHCDLCHEDGLTSGAKFWCQDCEVFVCDNCNRYHKRLTKNHVLVEVKERKKCVDLIMGKNCLFHGKSVDFYCKECNTCYCDTCYKQCHSSESPCCLSVSGPLRVREEMKRRRECELATVQREVYEFEEKWRGSREIMLESMDRLNTECLRECEKVWIQFEELMENERKNAEKLCDKIREKKCEKAQKWLECLKESEKMAKQVEIWRIHVEHLLQELEEEETGGLVCLGEGDVLCGLNDLICKWSGGGQQEGQKNKWSVPPPAEEFVEYKVTLPNWWLEAMHPSRKAENESAGGWCIIKTTKQQAEKLIPQNEFIVPPPESNPNPSGRDISSILVSPKDGHLLISDWINNSILELNKLGKMRNEFSFRYTRNKSFRPRDMCWVSPDNFVVCGQSGKSNIFFFKRVENPPFLQITKEIATKTQFYSVSKKEEIIFCSDLNFKILCFSQNGEEIKRIQFEGPPVGKFAPRLRFDGSGGNFWGSKCGSSCDVICWNSNGKKMDEFKKEENFFDFCFFDKNLFFVSKKGIFSFFPKKCLQEFEKETQRFPRISILGNKMFVCLKIEGKKDLIKIFEII